jgi:hypothetical protein
VNIKEAITFLTERGYKVLTAPEVEKEKRSLDLLLSYIKHKGNLSLVGKEFDLTRERVRQIFMEKFNLSGTGFRDDTGRLERIKEAFEKNGNCAIAAAKDLGVTAWYASNLRKTHFPELIPPQQKKSTADSIDDEMFTKLYTDLRGNMSKIARQLKVKNFVVYEKAQGLGLKAMGHVKISDKRFIQAYDDNEGSATAIAKELGLSLTAVYSRIRKIKGSK